MSRINLTAICSSYNWHRATIIDALIAQGLARPDAVAFTDFAFADRAAVSDSEPTDCVDNEQWSRLSISDAQGGADWIVDANGQN